MMLHWSTHLNSIAIFFGLLPTYVISSPLPDNTEEFHPIITPGPDLSYAVLFKRDTNTCGYITGNPNLPNTCSSPFACQWYTSAAGYPGQKFCTTDGYIVTANYGDFCLDYGNTACADTSSCLSKYGPWQNCENSLVPYCITAEYASGPGQVVEYTSYYCSTNTVSRTLAVYFEATVPSSPTTKTVVSTTTTAPPSTTPISTSSTSTSPTPTPTTTTPAPVQTNPSSSSSGGSSLDTGTIVGIAISIFTAVIAIVAIFTAAFSDAFRYWVLFSVPNFLCVRHRQPKPGSKLDKYIHGLTDGNGNAEAVH